MNQIIKETGYSKASVSLWTRDILLSEDQRKKISLRGRSIDSIEKRRASRMLNISRRRQEIINQAKDEIKNLSLHELKIVGAMLYWGEGRKTGNWSASIANSDPVIIKVVMRFFREVCKVPETKFRAHIHTFEGASIKETEKYWANITGISLNQFCKTYAKPNISSFQKRKTLPYGTVDVYVHDTKLFLTIKGWIERISELILQKC